MWEKMYLRVLIPAAQQHCQKEKAQKIKTNQKNKNKFNFYFNLYFARETLIKCFLSSNVVYVEINVIVKEKGQYWDMFCFC